MTEDYKKEQSILNKWFHLRAATQFVNSSGISGSSTACCTPSTLMSSSTGTSFGVVMILEGMKPAHYSRITKHPSAAVELHVFLEKLGRTAWAEEPGMGLGGSCCVARGGWLIPALQGRAKARSATRLHHRYFLNVFFFTLLFPSSACLAHAPSTL